MLIQLCFPANVNVFFAVLMQIIAFNVVDTTEFYNEKLALDQVDSLSSQFDNLGYSSLYSLQNFGSLIFIAVGSYIFMVVLWFLLPRKYFQRLRARIHRFMFFNGLIVFLDENYILISVCGCINTYYFKMTSIGNRLNVFFSVLLLATSVLFPIFVAIFYNLQTVV